MVSLSDVAVALDEIAFALRQEDMAATEAKVREQARNIRDILSKLRELA